MIICYPVNCDYDLNTREIIFYYLLTYNIRMDITLG